MKNRIAIWAMMLCLISSSTAFAVDWGQYAVGDDLFSVLSRFAYNGENVIWCNRDRDLIWERDGSRVAMLPHDDYPFHTAEVQPLPDGRCAVIMSILPLRRVETDSYSVSFWIWSEDGIEQIHLWHGNGCRAATCSEGFLVTFATGEAILHNLYGEQLWSGSLGTGTFCRVQGLAMINADDWACSLIDYYGDGTERAYTRVTGGEVAWFRYTEAYSRLTPLANGCSVLIEYRNNGKPNNVDIALLDPAGEAVASRRITGDRLVIDAVRALCTEDGSLMIYGSAVANSRRIYLVWRLMITPDLTSGTMEVRNASYHRDYSFGMRTFETDLSCWLHLNVFDDSGAPDVYVPYDALPVVTDHSLRYE